MSVFEKYRAKAFPYVFRATLYIPRIAGGTPTDPKVAEGWLKTKMGWDDDSLIQSAVAEIMAERGVSAEEAVQIVNTNRHLNGFKRDEKGLYIEGRQAKAAIKESANIRWPNIRWGPTRKGTLSFFPEHVFVQEDKIHFGVDEPSGVNQRFVHTWRGSGISYEEYVDDAEIQFTVVTDFEFTNEQWGLLWLTGEQQGLGSSRSQGFGRYEVVGWEQLK